jgi:hypothetical protein
VGSPASVDDSSTEASDADHPKQAALPFEWLTELLGILLSSPQAVGMEVTIFDPELDPDGSLAGRLPTCSSTASASP